MSEIELPFAVTLGVVVLFAGALVFYDWLASRQKRRERERRRSA